MACVITGSGPEVPRWGVVVPVKRLDAAKSRLAPLDGTARRALALAFAEDVVAAATACRVVDRVLVVTDDGDAAIAVRRLGAGVVADEPGRGIDAALSHGATLLGDPAAAVAAVSADLPALRPDDLAAVLRRTRFAAVVADAAGTGTTVLAAAPGVALRPRYGHGSLERHVADGADVLPAAAGIRRDVDTLADLRAALALGVGPRTAAVAAALGLHAGECRSPGSGTMAL
ncbi:MAG TPA: 2-phospho-L-lactate guanylyltransferase [Mycobacteriales bacterium]|nr:2-phospho-L-lactate guanylyltransferase [Mycobacteriales bacterium]